MQPIAYEILPLYIYFEIHLLLYKRSFLRICGLSIFPSCMIYYLIIKPIVAIQSLFNYKYKIMKTIKNSLMLIALVLTSYSCEPEKLPENTTVNPINISADNGNTDDEVEDRKKG